MSIQLRPLPVWPYDSTKERRYGQFKHNGHKISYDRTIGDLEYEVNWLQNQGQSDVITLGIGLRPTDIRLDGAPRANAPAPSHPGVEISFDSRYGRLSYATDVFFDWKDNVRAIAKGLEALRDLNRWGVAKRGQQYAGFALLTAGPGLEERGRQLVERFGSVKEALRHTHPDTGDYDMTVDDFKAVQAVRQLGAG
jgi:hypothetical protein